MKAIISAKDFNRVIAATKDFSDKRSTRIFERYIRLDFSASDGRMTAIAVDGFCMSVETAECRCDEDFTTYIRPDTKLPKYNGTISIEDTDRDTLIRCDSFIAGCSRIDGNNTFDWHEALPGAPEFRIAFNAKYLLKALRAALISRGKNLWEPVILEFHGPLEPVVFRTGKDNVKLVMPIRIKD